MKKRKGATLIESIISALLLSIVAIPLVTGFSQAIRNYNYSQDYYKAGLHAQNILSDIIYRRVPMENLFNSDYELDKFRYIVYLCTIESGSISSYESYSSHGVATPLEEVTFTDKSNQIYNAVSYCSLAIVDVYDDDKLIVRMLSPFEDL